MNLPITSILAYQWLQITAHHDRHLGSSELAVHNDEMNSCLGDSEQSNCVTLLALQPDLGSGDIDFGADQILHDLDDFTDGVRVKIKNQKRTPNLRN